MTMETAWKSDEGELIRVRTCGWSPPGDHPVGCGMFIYTDKDGKFVKATAVQYAYEYRGIYSDPTGIKMGKIVRVEVSTVA